MNFFERQRVARGTTVRLVLLFTLAVVAMVALVDTVVVFLMRSSSGGELAGALVASSAFMLLVIGGGMLTKTIALRAGGSAVALSVGAIAIDPTSTDPQLRRYVNIVEEMSLASGVPMPRLFVLPQEPGINAFAAGYTPADAAITVTAGALQQLNRDELQGVIGHEFSHILNGDMRLNIRLIGLLSGILLLGLIGLRILQFGGSSRDKKGNAAPFLLVAFAMMVVGFIGQFFAGLIKAAVSRQREWLADASAVQFTRQTTGLEGALKKIAGVPTGSRLTNARGAREVSHMLFGEGAAFSRLFATHPPIMERITALDPAFRPDEVAQLQQRWQDLPPNGLAEDVAMGLAPALPERAAPPGYGAAVLPAEVSARVGTVSPADLERGQWLSGQIPEQFRQLASQASTSVPLVLAMALSTDPGVRDRQLAMVAARLGAVEADATARLADDVASLAPLLRLPVVSLAIPQLTTRPRPQLDALAAALTELAQADGAITVFEYCLTRLVTGYIADANDPSGRSKPGSSDVARVSSAAYTLLAAVAAAGNPDPTAAQHAFDTAVDHLRPGERVAFTPPTDVWPALDAVWQPLESVDPRHKQRLVEALVVAVRDDGKLAVAEAELLRTACALLRCPLPAFVA